MSEVKYFQGVILLQDVCAPDLQTKIKVKIADQNSV